MTEPKAFICTTCAQSYALDTREWRCVCGGLFDLEAYPPFDAARIDVAGEGLQRYRALLPLDAGWELVTLGEGGTPLVQADWEGLPLWFKLESLNPTGSFKDRGSATLATALRGLVIEQVVEDSSGNAGASLAAYAARAGISCQVWVPGSAAGPKLVQMRAYGAEVVPIQGTREGAARAAWAESARGAYYASHVYNPIFLAGTETIAYELWEQLGHRAPAAMIVPVGNGTLLLGAYRGFGRLFEAGLVSRLPRLFAVQAAACAPVYHAFQSGKDALEPVASGPTVASGIAIGQPARGQEILAALRATDGGAIAVTEEEIVQAHGQLARQGFYVEMTSAAAVAALAALHGALPTSGEEPVVVPLTGHGLKTWQGYRA
jgi:threonine synthase